MISFIVLFLISNFAFAELYNAEYLPVNVHGYVSSNSTYSLNGSTEQKTTQTYKNSKLEENLRKIHQKYDTSINSIIIPSSDEDVKNQIKGYKKANHIKPLPAIITTNTMKGLCNDMGFNEKSQRNALEFYGCVTEAMKTKFTEETNKNTKYNQIDQNIVKALQSNTASNHFIESLSQYQELFNLRNKMDCLKENDYHKCSKSVIEYKTCNNKVVDMARIEHNRNKIICYVKTAIRFPNPSESEESTRDAYYGVCVHLIEKSLHKTITKHNAKCNQILTKHNFTHLAI
ncbi:MAG: hypothetical protein ACI9CD_001009 [Candidatus Deianiraeaceae bacterium]